MMVILQVVIFLVTLWLLNRFWRWFNYVLNLRRCFGARFFAMVAVMKFQQSVFSGASPVVLPMPAGILLPVEIAERFPALFGVGTARSASEIPSFTEKLRMGQSEVNRKLLQMKAKIDANY
jgi:hypothetical protein